MTTTDCDYGEDYFYDDDDHQDDYYSYSGVSTSVLHY